MNGSNENKIKRCIYFLEFLFIILVLLFAHLLLLYIYECKRNIESKSNIFIITSIMFYDDGFSI